MISIKNEFNLDLLYEELEAIPGAYSITSNGRRFANFTISHDGGNINIDGFADEQAVMEILAKHDRQKKGKNQLEKEAKEVRRKNILEKLKLTDEELGILIGELPR